MRVARPFVLSGALCAAIFAASESQAESIVQVKPVVEVEANHPSVMLSDIIVPRGLSRTAIEELGVVRLADTPRAGESRSFSESGLRDIFNPYLEAIHLKTGETFSLRMPSRVVVMVRKPKITASEVEKALLAKFKEVCVDCSFEIANLNLPLIPAEEVSDRWQIKAGPELPKGGFSIPLEIPKGDYQKRVYWINGSVVVRKLVPVASRELAQGEHLAPGDFTVQLKEVTFATDVAANDIDIKSSVLSRALPAGQIIWRSTLRKELAVKFGDAVKVMAGTEQWQITVDGIAQGSGYVGDLIRVKIPRTQKLISGMLTEKGLVEVRQ